MNMEMMSLHFSEEKAPRMMTAGTRPSATAPSGSASEAKIRSTSDASTSIGSHVGEASGASPACNSVQLGPFLTSHTESGSAFSSQVPSARLACTVPMGGRCPVASASRLPPNALSVASLPATAPAITRSRRTGAVRRGIAQPRSAS